MAKKNTTIYCDIALSQWHNPEFGSLENGNRVIIDVNFYRNAGYNITFASPDLVKHSDILKTTHGTNPLFNYLSTTKFDKTWFEKILRLDSHNTKSRNCHGCTTFTRANVCATCNTHRDTRYFFLYAHVIDNNILDSDTTYITHNSYKAIIYSTSLVCQMIDDICNVHNRNYHDKNIKHGFALVRPPGHHASQDKSQGFCLVNNIAVCAEYALQSNYNVKKIFIFDFDAHHGNGTQEIFYNRSDVYYCSMHTLDFYPKTGLESEKGQGSGDGYNLNIVVKKNITTDEYLAIVYTKVLTEIIQYNPDIILISAGFDGLISDPMKIMNLTYDCYGSIVNILKNVGVPIGMILEGGYDLEELSNCYDVCIKTLG